jgi:ketosteroid isomerase-like protein
MKISSRFLLPTILALAVSAASIAPAAAATGAAATRAAVWAPIQVFADAFNKGDAKTAATMLAPEIVVVDNVAPHLFTGKAAFENWGKALAADDTATGSSDGSVALAKPTNVIVSGDDAYVVAPAVYSFKRKGAAMQDRAQMVFTLHKGATGGWLITSSTWVGTRPPKAAPAK